MAHRAVATFTVYVYGEDDDQLFKEAKRIETAILNLDDNRASLDGLKIVPTGAIHQSQMREIDYEKMSLGD